MQRLYREKQTKIIQIRFTKAFQFRFKKKSKMKMKKVNNDISKQQVINRYIKINKKKNFNAFYLIKKNCANEHFSVYKCVFENIEKIFEFLKSKYTYFVPIKQNDKFEFFETKSTMTKKKTIFII